MALAAGRHAVDTAAIGPLSTGLEQTMSSSIRHTATLFPRTTSMALALCASLACSHAAAQVEAAQPAPGQLMMKIGDLCPSCGEAAMVNEEGCRKCYACGHSEC